MARPSYQDIESGTNGWDGRMDDNFDVAGSAPIPIHESAAITTLAALESAFPSSAHDRCFIWINLTTFGYTLCWSDGAQWLIYGADKRAIRSSSATTTQLITDQFVQFTGAGTVDYDFLAVASWPGKTVEVRNDSSGVVSLDPNSTELINGSSTSLSLPAGSTARIYNDGTALYAAIST